MSKVQLEILGMSANTATSSAYAIIMQEVDGTRRLPIVIGAFEAQAIALEMERIKPPRPMTHDLLKNIIEAVGHSVAEIVINDFKDSTFYAKIVFDSGVEVDARPSDAIALAIRFESPIFAEESILSEAGVTKEESGDEEDVSDEEKSLEDTLESDILPIQNKDSEVKELSEKDKLFAQLQQAIENEDYEQAAILRDKINNL